MKMYKLMIPALCILMGCAQSESSKQTDTIASVPIELINSLSAAELKEGWVLLFDGSTTDLWRGYNQESFPEQGWQVEDGNLIVEKSLKEGSGGGTIITRKMYRNFELSLEFMVSDTANSGILYLGLEKEEEPMWHTAPEFQILDNQTALNSADDHSDLRTHLTGDNYDLQAASKDYTNPVGEWNTARIVVNDGHVEHWLNGNKTIEYQINSEDWRTLVANSKFNEYSDYGQASRGHIGIQDHDHEVNFRNIKIREIENGTRLFNGEDLTGWTIHGTEKWYVEDGNLICESGPDAEYGYLATDKSYKDIDLTLEFKQEADGNCGVFFRSSLKGTKISGWQTEVAPPGNDTGGIYESYGREWLIKPDPEKDKALKMGEWNTMRIQVIGGKVTTWLNGLKMIELDDALIGQAEGQIALQIHSGGGIKVRWRNLSLREL